jgi:hypothetical protein
MPKPFDPDLYRKNDSSGKKQTIRLLYDIGNLHFLEEGEDKNGIHWDLLMGNEDGSWKFEVERRGSGVFGEYDKSYPLKFPTLHIPARKSNNSADIYVSISSRNNYAAVISFEKIREYVKNKSTVTINTALYEQDRFIDIPCEECLWYKNSSEGWKRYG